MTATGNQEGVDRLERGMPSLTHLEGSLRGKRELVNHLRGRAHPSGPGTQIANGLVRLVERSILDYQVARIKHIAFISDGILDDMYRAQDHFESCINSLHRAILYMERLRSLGYRRSDGQPFIPRPRDLAILQEPVKAKVRTMRDAAEHLDKDIAEGRLPFDASVGIHLGWDKATISDMTVDFADVARWLTQLHQFAGELSRVYLIRRSGSTEHEQDTT